MDGGTTVTLAGFGLNLFTIAPNGIAIGAGTGVVVSRGTRGHHIEVDTTTASNATTSAVAITWVFPLGTVKQIFNETLFTYNPRMLCTTGWVLILVVIVLYSLRNVAGHIFSIEPDSGPASGDQLVTISGVGLGNGSDITSVLLARQSAEIVSQTNNSVVVRSSPSVPSDGSVVVTSVSTGMSVSTAGYMYNMRMRFGYAYILICVSWEYYQY